MTRNRLGWLTARPIAHRGYHDIRLGRPENTLAAFAAAIEARYAIECDLRLSADGQPVVFHDDTLDRLTAESGPVHARSAAELCDLRILDTSERIPTLDALLTLTTGRVPLIIELKPAPGHDAGLARAAVERIRRYAGPVALMSFEPRLLAGVKTADPKIPRGLTAEGDWRRALRHFNTVRTLGVDFISYAIDDLPTPMPILARRLFGIPLICWTVRTGLQLQKAQKWVDQITFEGFPA